MRTRTYTLQRDTSRKLPGLRGLCMIVDRDARRTVEENLTSSAGSATQRRASFASPPRSPRAQPTLGAQAGEAKLRQVALDAGFKRPTIDEVPSA